MFAFLNQKNVERLKTLPKHRFSPLNAHIWAKIISISLARLKNEIEKWPLIHAVQCISVLRAVGWYFSFLSKFR